MLLLEIPQNSKRMDPIVANDIGEKNSLALLLLAHRVANRKGDAEVVLRDIFAVNVSDISLKWEQGGKCQPNPSTSKVKMNQQQEAIDALTAGMQKLLERGRCTKKEPPLRNGNGDLVCY